MRLLLLLLITSFGVHAQFTHSFFGTTQEGLQHHAILAPSNGTAVYATVNDIDDIVLAGELILTVAELDADGETYDYFRQAITSFTDDYYVISGYGTNNNELILTLIGQSTPGSSLHYIRYDRGTNTILQMATGPTNLKNGFVRTKQVGNELITYAVNNAGDFIRVATQINDVSQSASEIIATGVALSGSLFAGRKSIDFIADGSGNEFIAKEQALYKRSTSGAILNLILPSWSFFNGYDLEINSSNELVILCGNTYNVLDTSNLAILNNGTITGMPIGNYKNLEMFEDQNEYIFYAYKQSDFTTYQYRVNANFVKTDSLDLNNYINVIEVVKENNMHYMVGTKQEPVYNTWGIAVIYSDNTAQPAPFYEYNSTFDHYDITANTCHLNAVFWRIATGVHGFGLHHNGIEKSLIYAGANSIVGKDANDSITGLVSYYGTSDFLPGPYMPEYGTGALESYDKNNRAYYVTKEMIDYHRQYALYSWYEPPFGIKYWPGDGDVVNGQAQYIAPYYDENNNGTYDPYEGDYPLIYGDRCYLNVYHLRDSAGINGSDNKTEVLRYIYMFDCDTSEVLKNTVFINQEFILRNGALNDAYINSYIDPDVGYYNDDYIGTNVDLGMIYAYNGDLYDEYSGGNYGFQDTLPAVGVMTLKGAPVPVDGIDNLPGVGANQCTNGYGFNDGIQDNEYFTLVNSNYQTNGSPSSGLPWFDEQYNLYQGLNGNGTPQQVNGVNIRHSYYGSSDALHYTSDGIDPGTSHYEWGPVDNNPPGDRRIFGGTGPINIDAADPTNNSVMITNAYICAIDTVNLPNGNLIAPLDLLFNYGTDLKQMFASNDAGCSGNFDYYISPLSVGLKELELNATIYPNPTTNELNIVLDEQVGAINVEIVDLNGSLIAEDSGYTELQFNTSLWESGVYLVIINNGDRITRKKVVKM